ncbi:MAG: galactokinase family protein [Rhodothermales bacterium]
MNHTPAYVSSRFAHLEQVSGESSDHMLWVPGRIEVLGKHTDYAGGDSLTCASIHGMAVFVQRHAGRSLIIDDASRGQRVELLYDNPIPQASWTRYPSVVLSRVIRHFGAPPVGIRVIIHSDLPSASGMSSSSALIITVLLALLGELGKESLPFTSREDLAGFAGAIESGADWREWKGDDGVGTRGGSQDHTAILCSRAGMLSLFGYQPIRCHARVALPDSVSFIVAGSGVKARKTGEAKHAYNRASERAKAVAKLYSEDLDEYYPHMGAMMTAPHFDRESLRWAIPDDDLWDRFQQFEREVDHVIPEALRAIDAADWHTFKKVVSESQAMAAKWLHNQIPETESLAEKAVELGALAASSFGAGFGGAVWALVSSEAAEHFAEAWKAAYAQAFPHRANDMVILGDEPGIPAWTSPTGYLATLD